MKHKHHLEEYKKKYLFQLRLKDRIKKHLCASEFKMEGNDFFRKRRTKEFRSISSNYNEWVKDSYGGKRRYQLLFWTLYVNRP
jgi:hypothetical protein